MKRIFIETYKSPVGELILGSFEDQLVMSDWKYRRMRKSNDQRIMKGLDAVFIEEQSKVTSLTIQQMEEYFNGERMEFDIPLLLVGTDFQKKVWKALMKIPFGKTMTYLSLSKKLKNEKAIRAVAGANGANAISLIVPCHRIIGSNGDLVGYAGGLRAKKKLLELEGAINTDQLELF